MVMDGPTEVLMSAEQYLHLLLPPSRKYLPQFLKVCEAVHLVRLGSTSINRIGEMSW